MGITTVVVWGALFLTRPPPTRVVVDSDGVRFDYASGASRQLRWNNPKFHLTLTDFRHAPDEEAVFYVGRPLPEQARISCPAALAILDEARQRGVDVTRSPENFSATRAARVTLRYSRGQRPAA